MTAPESPPVEPRLREAYARVALLAGRGEGGALARTLRGLDDAPERVAATLRAHHLVHLVLSRLDEAAARRDTPGDLLAALERQRPVQPVPTAELLDAFDEARRALEAEGVPVLMMKGAVLAERLYGAAARRPQYDVDLLVRAAHRRRAERVLRRRGFARVAYDLHSRTFARDGVKLDVHDCLRRAPAYRLDERVVWASATPVRVGPLEALTLSDELHLVLLVLAAFEDLGQGAARLKQLLDLHLLAGELDATLDWPDFLGRRAAENLAGVTATALALVGALFDPADHPRLAAVLGGHPDARVTRALAVQLAFAGRKRPESLRWFADVYPGRLAPYLARFWLGGFPANVGDLDAARLRALPLLLRSGSDRRS